MSQQSHAGSPLAHDQALASTRSSSATAIAAPSVTPRVLSYPGQEPLPVLERDSTADHGVRVIGMHPVHERAGDAPAPVPGLDNDVEDRYAEARRLNRPGE
jgi:hypothetical protein